MIYPQPPHLLQAALEVEVLLLEDDDDDDDEPLEPETALFAAFCMPALIILSSCEVTVSEKVIICVGIINKPLDS